MAVLNANPPSWVKSTEVMVLASPAIVSRTSPVSVAAFLNSQIPFAAQYITTPRRRLGAVSPTCAGVAVTTVAVLYWGIDKLAILFLLVVGAVFPHPRQSVTSFISTLGRA